MQKKVNYVLIGFGNIAASRLAREGFGAGAGKSSPAAANLIGATDIDPARRQTVEDFGLQWYQDIKAVLADPAVDAVFIATGNSSHADLSLQAMEAGKHCLVEKPIAVNMKQAKKLVEKARQSQLSLAVDHMMCKNSFNRQAKRMASDEIIGKINDFCFHMEFSFGSTPGEARSWRCSDPAELGGPIGDVGSHCLYMAEYMFDCPVSSLRACFLPKRLPIEVEDGAIVFLTLNNGLCGTVRVSFAEPRGGLAGTISNLGYEIYGTQGVLRGYGTMFQLSGFPDDPVKLRLEHESEDGVASVSVPEPVNMYTEVIDGHARSIIAETPMDGSAGCHNLELVLAAYEAAERGEEIEITDRAVNRQTG